MVTVLDDLLSEAECTGVLELLAKAGPREGWQDGRATSGAQSAGVKNNQQMPADSLAARSAQTVVLNALQRSALFLAAALPKRIVPPLFNRYAGQTNAFGQHIDNAIRSWPGQAGEYLRTDLSCTVFLTEPESYEGGELVIDLGGQTHSYKLPAGCAVLYPASTLHRVNPVRSGERIASFFWVESLVKSAEQRELLFNMDMCLLQLRHEYGETPQATALTGTYHNLLRMWAQT
jgi:PKHD-type hydroxylase